MFLHLAGSAVWLGLLAALALVHRSLEGEAADAVRRVSRMAIWAAWLIVASGAINAWLRLGSFTELFTTTYGRLLLAKLLLMSAAIALGFVVGTLVLTLFFFLVMTLDVASGRGRLSSAMEAHAGYGVNNLVNERNPNLQRSPSLT